MCPKVIIVVDIAVVVVVIVVYVVCWIHHNFEIFQVLQEKLETSQKGNFGMSTVQMKTGGRPASYVLKAGNKVPEKKLISSNTAQLIMVRMVSLDYLELIVFTVFLVTCTRLYKSLCQSAGWTIGQSFGHSIHQSIHLLVYPSVGLLVMLYFWGIFG